MVLHLKKDKYGDSDEICSGSAHALFSPFSVYTLLLSAVRRRHHIEGGSSTQGHSWVTRVICRFIYLLFAALVDRSMDTVDASNSLTWALPRLSLLSDCCNDNPGPVICTLQVPSSTSACIFTPAWLSSSARISASAFDLLFNYGAPIISTTQRRQP